MAEAAPVAFLGLGAMGAPMASHLARAERPLAVWNRTAAKAEPLRELGARVARTPADAAAGAGVIVTMLWDAAAVDAVLLGPDGVVEQAAPGAIVVDMSTTSPGHPPACAARLAEHGLRFLDAPVTGALPGARDGTLLAMVGGEAETLAAARPALAPMVRDARLVGPHGAGQLVKLATNLVGFENVLALCEGLALVSAGGGDVAAAAEVLAQSTARSQAVDRFAPLLSAGDLHGGGLPAALARKDVGAALAAASEAGIALPAGDALLRLLGELADARAGCHAVYELLRAPAREGGSDGR